MSQDENNHLKPESTLAAQIKSLLSVLRQVRKDNSHIQDLEKKRDEFKSKYENYKKLALKEKDEKEQKIRDLDLLKKEKSQKNIDESKKDTENGQAPNVQEKYENLKIMYNK